MADISKVEIGGVSYNVKDAAAREMIKNLPTGGGGGGAGSWKDLGEGFGEGVLLEETTLTEQSTQIDKELGLVAESVYTVNWNGTEYTPTAVDASAMVGVTGAVVLGMSSKYPFTILAKPGNGVSISIDSGSAPVTVSITGLGNTIIPIPGKYLPKGTPWIEGEVYLEESGAIASTHPSFGKMWTIAEAPLLEPGKTYTVIYNGASYNCVCQPAPAGFTTDENAVAMGNFSVAGGPNTGEPFAMLISHYYQRIDIIDLASSSSVRVAIHAVGTSVQKIDYFCLPDTMIVNANLIDLTADKNCDEIWEAMRNKQNVFMTYNAGDQSPYMICFCCIPNLGAFFIDASKAVDSTNGIIGVSGTIVYCVKPDGSIVHQ